MKPVFIKFTDDEGKTVKTFTACRLKTGMMDDIFDVAERAEKLDSKDTSISDIKEFYADLKDTILKIFKYQFSLDELNKNVEQEKLMETFKDLCETLGGEMVKN